MHGRHFVFYEYFGIAGIFSEGFLIFIHELIIDRWFHISHWRAKRNLSNYHIKLVHLETGD